jgi:hypothetical protein
VDTCPGERTRDQIQLTWVAFLCVWGRLVEEVQELRAANKRLLEASRRTGRSAEQHSQAMSKARLLNQQLQAERDQLQASLEAATAKVCSSLVSPGEAPPRARGV